VIGSTKLRPSVCPVTYVTGHLLVELLLTDKTARSVAGVRVYRRY